mgnify:CR=1 FL=1
MSSREKIEKLEKLFTIKKVQIEMMASRGFEITEEEREIYTNDLEYFIEYYEEMKKKANKGKKSSSTEFKIRDMLTKTYYDYEGERMILVFYAADTGTKSVSIEAVKVLATHLDKIYKYGDKQFTIKDVVFIIPADLSSETRSQLTTLLQRKRIQVFYDKELMFNVTEHVYVPKYEVFTKEESEKLLKQMRALPSQLAIIYEDDPPIKFLGIQDGTIVRESPNYYALKTINPNPVRYCQIRKRNEI